jgi:hypothetical protein
MYIYVHVAEELWSYAEDVTADTSGSTIVKETDAVNDGQ